VVLAASVAFPSSPALLSPHACTVAVEVVARDNDEDGGKPPSASATGDAAANEATTIAVVASSVRPVLALRILCALTLHSP
jgi:hypothetical protein